MMSLQCDRTIQSWMKVDTFNAKSKNMGYSSGNFYRLADVVALPCSTSAHTPLGRNAITNAQFGLDVMTSPEKHSAQQFCYLVHVVDDNTVFPKPRTPQEAHLQEKQVRTQNALLYHPEYSQECMSLNMHLIDEKSQNILNGTVGYIYAPVDLKRIALANSKKPQIMSWDESTLKSAVSASKKSGARLVDAPEKIIKESSKVIVWGGQSKVGGKIRTNDLIPIATFSVSDAQGQALSPELSRWMKMHARDFNIPHISLPASLAKSTSVEHQKPEKNISPSLAHRSILMTDKNILRRRLN